jgi:branched-chain amino acid transport system substrate-binding protein
MQSRQRRTIGAVTVALLGSSVLAVPAGASAEPAGSVARIYVSLPRQGQGAPSAAQIAKGLRVALADHRATAGGRRIRIVWMDDAKGARWNRARVVANARRAVADPSAIAYVGEGNSEASAVSMPIVNRAGLVHLSPVSTASALTDAATAGRYQPSGVQTFFRPVPGDARQSAALRSAVRRAGVRKRVVLVDDGSLYGRGLTQGFAAGASGARVSVVGRYVADRDGKGLSQLARRVAGQRPTAIVYGGAPSSSAAKVLRALHRRSPRALLFGGDALAHDDFVARLGAAQGRIRVTTPAAHVDPRKKAGRSLGKRPDTFSVFAYNGMDALLSAVDRAGKRGPVTRASVRDAVFDGSIQNGLSGQWQITDRGDSVYGIYDIVRAARGRTVTPIDQLSDQLVRRAKAKRTGASRATAPPAAERSTVPMLGTAGVSAITLGSMDLETALMAVQQQRTQLLDSQLAAQIADVQRRNEQIAKLNEVLGALNVVLTYFPPDATATARLDGSGAAGAYAESVARARSAETAAGLKLDLPQDGGAWTRGQLDAAIQTVKAAIDQAGNVQQLDMLRLQALTNKRNEAFAVLAAFLEKMRQTNAAILNNQR